MDSSDINYELYFTRARFTTMMLYLLELETAANNQILLAKAVTYMKDYNILPSKQDLIKILNAMIASGIQGEIVQNLIAIIRKL